MATKKKLLQAAAGTAAASGGAGALNVEDVFSTYLYEGNGSFQAIGNGIKLGQSGDGGSVLLDAGQNNYLRPSSNSGFALGTGAFTIEAFYFHRGSTGDLGPQFFDWDGTSSQLWFGFYGTTLYLRTASNSDLTASLNQQVQTWTHVAAVRDSSGNMSLYHNGTRVASGTGFNATNVTGTQPYIGSNAAGGTASYTDGFLSNIRISNTARYSGASITVPTSGFTSDSDTVLLTAQGDSPLTDNSSNALTITTNGDVTASTFGPFDAASAGEGGMVWIKQRTNAYGHYLYDTERGVQKGIASDSTAVEQTGRTGVTSFNSNGFSLGNFTYENGSGNDIASWTFRKAPKFFDVVTYTGTGNENNTINHNLGSVPGMIIVKRTDSTSEWLVYHRGVNGGTNPEQYNLRLQGTDAQDQNSIYFSNTAPTATTFTVGSLNSASGGSYVAYLFAHNDGDGEFGPDGDQDIIKCGSYTGTGSAGNEIDLGFEAQWVLIRRSDSAEDWFLYDVMRGMNNGSTSARLLANTSAAEDAPATVITATSTGFKLISINSAVNGSGGNYIYIAIRRGPMAVPTDATDVFAVDTLDSTGSGYDSNFVVDMAFERNVSSASDTRIASRLTGATTLRTNTTEAEGAQSSNVWDFMDGWFYDGTSNSSKYSWMWKRAPSFCDVVAYTGNGTAQTITHNLGVTPEFILLKNRSTVVQWTGYHKDLNGGTNPAHYKIVLNQTNGEGGSSHWNYTSPTSSDFTVGSSMSASSNNYIAYLFASLDGVSKVFSVTKSSGSDASVNCGFSAGPRFVLLKRTDSTGDWYVWDSERGIVAGNDPYLLLNSTAAEVTSTDYIDPTSNGFTIVNGGLADGDYIGYAVA